VGRRLHEPGLNVFRLSSRVTAGARKQPFFNPQTQIGPVG
jgi:hypothetical protein